MLKKFFSSKIRQSLKSKSQESVNTFIDTIRLHKNEGDYLSLYKALKDNQFSLRYKFTKKGLQPRYFNNFTTEDMRVLNQLLDDVSKDYSILYKSDKFRSDVLQARIWSHKQREY